MTTDNFTNAAREEAERIWPSVGRGQSRAKLDQAMRGGFQVGAEWAREQEPTDAELDAAYAAFMAHNGPDREFNEFHERCCVECGYAITWPSKEYDGGKRGKRHAAHAALTAARAARRDEETR